jgi:hypothetical protein
VWTIVHNKKIKKYKKDVDNCPQLLIKKGVDNCPQ